MSAGKGDTPRPFSVDQETYRERYPLERVKAPQGAVYVAGKGWVQRCRCGGTEPCWGCDLRLTKGPSLAAFQQALEREA